MVTPRVEYAFYIFKIAVDIWRLLDKKSNNKIQIKFYFEFNIRRQNFAIK